MFTSRSTDILVSFVLGCQQGKSETWSLALTAQSLFVDQAGTRCVARRRRCSRAGNGISRGWSLYSIHHLRPSERYHQRSRAKPCRLLLPSLDTIRDQRRCLTCRWPLAPQVPFRIAQPCQSMPATSHRRCTSPARQSFHQQSCRRRGLKQRAILAALTALRRVLILRRFLRLLRRPRGRRCPNDHRRAGDLMPPVVLAAMVKTWRGEFPLVPS